MRPLLHAAVLAGLALPAAAADPALVRVTLSSGGVGQFEFTADVTGRATLPLDVKLDQVDDVLKSLRAEDPAGPITLRLPGRQPLAESFRTLPFTPAAFESAEALLGALVGEAVRVPSSGVGGSILAVTPFEIALPNGGGTLTRHRLAIATATGIETLVLEDTPGLELASSRVREQIASALTAIAAQRVQDRRTVQLTLAEGGARSVRFGYVVPAPVWKASYRLTVPAEGAGGGAGGDAVLQGFAVVENLSGRDWRDVEVVLTSGQPVLFHQPLYEAVFTSRPEAPVDVPNRLAPPVDPGSVAEPPPPPSPAAEARGRALMPSMARPAPAPMAAMAPGMAREPDETPSQPADMRQSVAQVEYRLADRVTAAAGESLMLPIITRSVPVRRVALFQPETDPLHPLVALLLKNSTAGAMPPGLVTLFEHHGDGSAGFIGDARLPTIQPGEERLASFAADLAVRIETTRAADTVLTSGKANQGVLELVRRERASTTYRITTPATAGRTVLIEQPKRPGWTLAEPAGAASTPTQYRIEQAVPPGTTASVTVVLERPRSERVALMDLDRPRLLAFAEEGRLTPGLRAAMGRAAALRTELDRRQGALRDLRDHRGEVVADQDRIRRNLGAVPANSELQRRYLAQLQQQEADLAALAAQSDQAQRGVAEADAALRDYLQSLNL